MASYLVIGGNGFLGQHVQEQIRLVKDASTITVFDLSRPKHPEPDVRYVVGDLRNYQDVYDALEGITAVIHTASPPPVDSDHPPRDLYFDINVNGTLNVIKACQERGIKVLVVTSSGSVISTGEEMVNVDEDTPYPSKAIDVYTESKIECEKQVLNANGVKGLLTCTLRPSAIFGPRDPLMIPGMIQICRNGQHRYQTGNNQSLMDFTYVGNIAYAHVLAAQKLATPGSGAAGQAFNVTNGTPIPFWDFASRVWATYGYHMPNHKKIILSKQTSFTIASIQEKIYRFKLLFWDESQVKKSLSKARLKQAMASRYFNIEKARTILGYEPQVSLDEGIKLSVAWYKEQYPQ